MRRVSGGGRRAGGAWPGPGWLARRRPGSGPGHGQGMAMGWKQRRFLFDFTEGSGRHDRKSVEMREAAERGPGAQREAQRDARPCWRIICHNRNGPGRAGRPLQPSGPPARALPLPSPFTDQALGAGRAVAGGTAITCSYSPTWPAVPGRGRPSFYLKVQDLAHAPRGQGGGRDAQPPASWPVVYTGLRRPRRQGGTPRTQHRPSMISS